MDFQPTLENDRVAIRPLKERDREALYEVAKDPAIWEQHPCKRYLRTEFDAYFKESIRSGGALALVDKVSGRLIGSSRFKQVDGLPNAVEIGWTFLGRAFWGGAYNGMVKELMMGHAFKHAEMVIFHVASSNVRSQKAVEKIGGQPLDKKYRDKIPALDPGTLTYIVKRPPGTPY